LRSLHTTLTETPARLTRYTPELLHTGHDRSLVIRWNIMIKIPPRLFRLIPVGIHVHIDAGVHVIEQTQARIPMIPAPISADRPIPTSEFESEAVQKPRTGNKMREIIALEVMDELVEFVVGRVQVASVVVSNGLGSSDFAELGFLWLQIGAGNTRRRVRPNRSVIREWGQSKTEPGGTAFLHG
jgi:hypothetical protein